MADDLSRLARAVLAATGTTVVLTACGSRPGRAPRLPPHDPAPAVVCLGTDLDVEWALALDADRSRVT